MLTDNIGKMSNQEILDELRSNKLLNLVRREVSSAIGRAERQGEQRCKLDIFEVRREEFRAAQRILDVLRDAGYLGY